MVVGKNFAKYMYHCHNWQVGLRVLGKARTDAEAALCFGFLSHLAADIVAHNFFVPYKTVESFRTLAAKHTYWELRFDKTALEHSGVWDTLRRIGQKKFPHHDEFLSQELVHASRLFSFGTSKTLFSSMMFLSRLEQWQGLIAKVAARSPLPLTAVETTEFRQLALEAIFTFLCHAERSATLSIDPTGARSLRVAKELRHELRLAWKSGALSGERWPHVAQDVRLRFRNGMHGDLDMPMADCLLAAR